MPPLKTAVSVVAPTLLLEIKFVISVFAFVGRFLANPGPGTRFKLEGLLFISSGYVILLGARLAKGARAVAAKRMTEPAVVSNPSIHETVPPRPPAPRPAPGGATPLAPG